MKPKKEVIKTKEDASKWLSNLGLAVSGTKEELLTRISGYQKWPKLVEKLKSRTKRYFKFKCSMDPTSIPPPSACWDVKESKYPVISQDIMEHYLSFKKEGNKGQVEKAHRMLQSRKIISVKTLEDQGAKYVKAMIQKSYGSESRPAVILFFNNLPTNAHCNCPVGASGLCCHIIALLLFLKHYKDTGEKIFRLTCTEQLQKWHKRTTKGSIPMMALAKLKLRSAKKKKRISAADSDNSRNKRNVPEIISKMQEKLKNFVPVTEHVYSVLSKSALGRKSSVGQHLLFKNKVNSLSDHQYLGQYSNEISLKKQKIELKSEVIDKKIEQMLSGKPDDFILNPDVNKIKPEDIILQDTLNIELQEFKSLYETDPDYIYLEKNIHEQSSGEISIDICFREAPIPYSTNHIDLVQNTPEWQEARKFRITGSRISSLLGLHGEKKFVSCWDIVRGGKTERSLKGITNIERGHYYEKDGIQFFQQISKATAESCGFYIHPTNPRFGASPDALGPDGILIEMKTRTDNAESPLESMSSYPNYYLQCQLQMECTGAHTCILVSYLPEKETANFFAVKRDQVLMNIIMDVCMSILNNEPLVDWYEGDDLIRNIGLQLLNKPLNFNVIKPLTRYIKDQCKSKIQRLNFVDEIDLQVNRL
eukprot:TCONS_00028513-protein